MVGFRGSSSGGSVGSTRSGSGSRSGWFGGSKRSSSNKDHDEKISRRTLYASSGEPIAGYGLDDVFSLSLTEEDPYACKFMYKCFIDGMSKWGDDYKWKEKDIEYLKQFCGYKVIE